MELIKGTFGINMTDFFSSCLSRGERSKSCQVLSTLSLLGLLLCYTETKALWPLVYQIPVALSELKRPDGGERLLRLENERNAKPKPPLRPNNPGRNCYSSSTSPISQCLGQML